MLQTSVSVTIASAATRETTKTGMRGRVIGALDERQSRDDLRRGVEFERRPPRTGAGGSEGGDEAEIAARCRHGFDHARRAHMRLERHGETEMKSRGIAHQRIAGRQVGMHGKRRLHIGESRNDDPPDALDGIERQVAVMAADQPAHHVGLARGAKGRAYFLGLFHRDQAVDDLTALHQQLVHRGIDAIDVAPYVGERQVLLARRFWHGDIRQSARLIEAVKAEIKENVDSRPKRPIYAPLTAKS